MPSWTKEFLSNLFGGIPEKSWFYIWHLKTKKSKWFQADAIEQAALHAESLEGDCYTSGGISPKRLPPTQRCVANEVSGLVGLWADIDFAWPGAKKKNLPPTFGESMSIAMSVVLPTIIIHSGHGIQAWWLFKEPWLFSDSADHAKGALLMQTWQGVLRSKAEAKRWTMDATHDLARVMRMPGTFNCKEQANKLPVRVVECEWGRRYDPEHFLEFTDAAESIAHAAHFPALPSANGHMAASREIVSVIVREDAEPPALKLLALLKNKEAMKAWERKRSTAGDDSPSGQDFCLALYAAKDGWSAQEIANLIIACRKHNDEKLKADNHTYYQNTANNAIQLVASERWNGEWIGRIEELLRGASTEELLASYEENGEKKDNPKGSDTNGVAYAAPITNGTRDAMLKELGAFIGCQALTVVQYAAQEPDFSIVTDRGEVKLGTFSMVLNQGAFRARIGPVTKFLPKRFKQKQWDIFGDLILKLSTPVYLGGEATDEGAARSWVTGYLADFPPADEEDKDKSVRASKPFHHGGVIHFFESELAKWVWLHRQRALNPKALGMILRAAKIFPKGINYTTSKGKQGYRNTWVVESTNYETDL